MSNGTAVLGLGNIGPLASKPVMEGKSVLFKRFADIDVFDLEIDATEPSEIIRFCEMLEPTVGGINLEDIKAPECFYIEEKLRSGLDSGIPRRSARHSDHRRRRFLNAVEVTGKNLADVEVVFGGAGAAAIATAEHSSSSA